MSDGTEAGTVLVKGFGPAPPLPLIALDGILYLQVESGLWRSDGTEAGTTLIRDGIIPAGGFFACGGSVAAVNGILVFPGRDANGCELWRSDGATADLLMDINPGSASSMLSTPTTPFREVGGLVLFMAEDGTHGFELWATDGTTAHLVQDIAEGAGWSTPRSFTPVGPLVFFTADDHLVGTELWAISRSALHERQLNVVDTATAVTTEDAPAPRRRPAPDEYRAFLPAGTGDELVAQAADR